MPTHTHRVEGLFHEALEHPTRERRAYLINACDAELRSEVESLLEAHGKAETFIERPALRRFPELPCGDAPDSLVGRRIGAYRLLRLIASGGMGTVYEAEQDQPRRTVALKVMMSGLGSRSALRRFQYESQILAKLRHPGIAQVYEAGVAELPLTTHHSPLTTDPQVLRVPYFAMEYIPNARTITEYASVEGLTIQQRLELFIKVCDAVQHGHQRGVIHRDLKPGNILVGDEKVEKSKSRKVETNGAVASSLITHHSSLSLASPKIIDFGIARATDSDVSSTHLQTAVGQLVGTLQYMSPEQCDADPASLDARSDVYSLGLVLYELLCGRPPYNVSGTSLSTATRIIKEEPPRRPAAVNRRLRGDLETIALKALEKDRERRYQSAADLAQELQRLLHNQPIQARPPSALYQFRKLVARHKLLFASLAIFAMLLTAFGVGMTVLYGRAEANLARAKRAETSARCEAQSARQVSDHLVNLFRSLDPSVSGGLDECGGAPSTLWELLQREARAIPQKLTDQPLTQAALLDALASVYCRFEMFGQGAELLRAALALRRLTLGEEHPAVVDNLEQLAVAVMRKGEYAEAERLFGEALPLRRRAVGSSSGRPTAPANTLTSLAMVQRNRGEFGIAEQLYSEALQLRRQHLGEDHPDTVLSSVHLATCLRLSEDYAAAERLCREALDRYRRRPDASPITVSNILFNLAAILRDQGHDAQAEQAYREGLHIGFSSRPGERPVLSGQQGALAGMLKARGDLTGAEVLYREALDTLRARMGEDYPSTGGAMYELAQLLMIKGDDALLAELETEFLAQRERARALPEDHPVRSGSLLHLAVMRLYRGDPTGAEPLLRECVALRRRFLSPEHWLTAYAESVLGGCLTRLGRFAEAESLLKSAYERLRFTLGRRDDRTLRTERRLMELHEAWSNPAAFQNPPRRRSAEAGQVGGQPARGTNTRNSDPEP